MPAETKPAVATGSAALSEVELVSRIAEQLKQMNDYAVSIKKTVLHQAIKLGELLLQAKERVGHGKFGEWLQTNNLDISERSAQRYMMLKAEWPKIEAWCKANSATVADLSLNKAQQIIAAPVTKPSIEASDLYDKAQENLIKKLKKLSVDDADLAASATIKELKKTVDTMKAGAKAA